MLFLQKIIFVNRFFYPDHSATSQLLTDLVVNLDFPEKEIHIVTSRMKYDAESAVLPSFEVWKNAHVHRCWSTRFGRSVLVGRAVDYLTFYISSFITLLLLTAKNDVVVAKTDPPLISVICAIAVKLKKAVLINWIQDLFPEVAKELGIRLFTGYIFKITKFVRNWSLKVAQFNIVLGEIMAERIDKEINRPCSTIIIPNWVIGREMKPFPRNNNSLRQDWTLGDKFVIGYSGNLGRAHDYKTILNAAMELKYNKDIIFIFIGGGAGYDILKRESDKLNLSNVLFKPYQTSNLLSLSLSVPDVHLISLEPALEGLIVPSKFYGILSVGRTMIFLGDSDGEIARELKKGECGNVVMMGDHKNLASIIIHLYTNKVECKVQSDNARSLYENKFMVEKSISDWRRVLINASSK